MTKKKYTVKPGTYILLDACSVTGGVHYEREYADELSINDGAGVAKQYTTVKTIDNVALCKEGEAIVAQARHLLRKHGSYTSLGYVANADQTRTLLKELAELHKAAETFNARARLQRCGRRIHVSIVPTELAIDNEAAAAEIARSIQSTLRLLHERLEAREGPKADVMIKTKCKNLERLVPSGVLRFAVRDAVTCAKNAVKLLRKAAGKKAKAADKDPELDLTALESALGLFTTFGSADELAEVA